MIERAAGVWGIVEGTIEISHRRGAGWFVGEIDLGGEPLPVVGVLHDVDDPRPRVLAGLMEENKLGELQFRVRGEVDTNLSGEQLRAYLRSGLVWRVGPATADAILEGFGEQAVHVLLREPERLLDVPGITAASLPEVRRSLVQTLPLAGIVGLLAPFGVPVGVCRQISRRYGVGAVAAIRANPWLLSMEFSGVGFRAADAIALELGFAPDAPERFEAAALHCVQTETHEGHTYTPREVLAHNAAELLDAPFEAIGDAIERLIAGGTLTALEQPEGIARADLAAAESRLAASLAEMLAHTHDESVADVSDDDLATLEEAYGIGFDATQRVAITGALRRGVTVLTGGPGTGKTTIVRAICDLAEDRGLVVALTSFTGKAAKVLGEMTGREAVTIHRYLRFTPEIGFLGPAEEDDVVIVDEASMLDIALAGELVSWLSPRTRLIVVGDVDQLPSIGPGSVLADLVATPAVEVFRLDTIHRTATDSAIPLLARAIKEGSSDLPFDRRTTRFYPLRDGEEIAEWIRRHFLRYRDRVEEFQVLAPMKKGTAGVDDLNGIIVEAVRDPLAANGPALVREAYELRAGDRIIWTINDYQLGLFNGQIGTLKAVLDGGRALVEFDGAETFVAAEKTSSFSLAYALTVHKAQGSQFPTVLMVVDRSASHMLARRLLYTGVSRARRTVAILGQMHALTDGIARHEEYARRTALGYLVRAAVGAEPPVG